LDNAPKNAGYTSYKVVTDFIEAVADFIEVLATWVDSSSMVVMSVHSSAIALK